MKFEVPKILDYIIKFAVRGDSNDSARSFYCGLFACPGKYLINLNQIECLFKIPKDLIADYMRSAGYEELNKKFDRKFYEYFPLLANVQSSFHDINVTSFEQWFFYSYSKNYETVINFSQILGITIIQQADFTSLLKLFKINCKYWNQLIVHLLQFINFPDLINIINFFKTNDFYNKRIINFVLNLLAIKYSDQMIESAKQKLFDKLSFINIQPKETKETHFKLNPIFYYNWIQRVKEVLTPGYYKEINSKPLDRPSLPDAYKYYIAPQNTPRFQPFLPNISQNSIDSQDTPQFSPFIPNTSQNPISSHPPPDMITSESNSNKDETFLDIDFNLDLNNINSSLFPNIDSEQEDDIISTSGIFLR